MFAAFREIVVADFEFSAKPGERLVPVCLVARELKSGRRFRIWQDQFGRAPPYATGVDVLFVAFFASAELGCYQALGWRPPERVLDLFCEFRDRTNGLETPAGSSLLGALTYFGIDGVGASEKKEMQEAIGTSTWAGRFSREEVLDYCESDGDATTPLLMVMAPQIDLPRALLRGRYMVAVAAMEYAGVPIDLEMLACLRAGWTGIQDQLIAAIDCDYGVYDGRTFKLERFANYLAMAGIPWPRHESGRLDLGDDTFREMARAHPGISPLRELRSALSDLRLNDLAVGWDGRNRCLLSPFRARSSRNQPSNSKFIFGPSVWLRGLIKPPPGYAIAYIDWSQQEFGIAAALSGDPRMQEAYRSGDPYLAFAKQAGAAPPDLARDLLRAHHQTYPVFWRWSDSALDCAMMTNSLHTVFGWHIHVGEKANPRSLRNFPMQANGAEMMRLAACLATERGVEVCAPVHDAFLIAARLDRLEEDIAVMRGAMAEAARVVLKGFELGSDASIVRWPHRYMDPRGRVMWDRVCGLLPLQQRATA